jgi:hypothetical protein
VVLLDLLAVEEPAVVLVLAVTPPAPPEPDAEMQPVGAEATGGVGWLTDLLPAGVDRLGRGFL